MKPLLDRRLSWDDTLAISLIDERAWLQSLKQSNKVFATGEKSGIGHAHGRDVTEPAQSVKCPLYSTSACEENTEKRHLLQLAPQWPVPHSLGIDIRYRKLLEHRAGIEPANTGFADQRVSHFATGAQILRAVL
jgi:hypothetical protein